MASGCLELSRKQIYITVLNSVPKKAFLSYETPVYFFVITLNYCILGSPVAEGLVYVGLVLCRNNYVNSVLRWI